MCKAFDFEGEFWNVDLVFMNIVFGHESSKCEKHPSQRIAENSVFEGEQEKRFSS